MIDARTMIITRSISLRKVTGNHDDACFRGIGFADTRYVCHTWQIAVLCSDAFNSTRENVLRLERKKKKNFYGNVHVDASITFTCIWDPISEIKLTVNRMLTSFPIIAITKRTYFVLYTQGIRMSSMELKYLKNITTTWNYLRYNSYTKHKLRETNKTLYTYRCSIKYPCAVSAYFASMNERSAPYRRKILIFN